MITGLESAAARANEAERLMTWAFRQFSQEVLIDAGKTVALAEVWLGREKTVPLVIKEKVEALIPYSARDEIKMSVSYKGPLSAPVKTGSKVGTLSVEIPGIGVQTFPVFTGSDVEQSGLIAKMRVSASRLLEAVN